jgi:hypothetical protein
MSYLRAGGNLLLMTRMGQDFVYEALRGYLGIQWAEEKENTTRQATSVYGGLVNMPRLGTQSYNAVFDTSQVGEESQTLFVQLNVFPTARGLGVWRDPSEGGSQRPDGGQCVFISGRPYRYEHAPMRTDSEWILRNLFAEPYDASGVEEGPSAVDVMLSQNAPNPFGSTTRIVFSLSKPADVRLGVYDVRGREIAGLVDGKLGAGRHSVAWDGVDGAGHRVASGVYWCLLEANDKAFTRKVVVLE